MITVTFDKESEYQWMRGVMAAGELNGRYAIDTLNECLDTPLISPNQTIAYKRSDSYENDLDGHVIKKGKYNDQI